MSRNLLVIMSAHYIPAYWAVKNSGSSRPWQHVCFFKGNLLFMSTDWSNCLLCMEQKEAILDGLELKICWGTTELVQVNVDTWIRLVQTFVLSILLGFVFCSPVYWTSWESTNQHFDQPCQNLWTVLKIGWFHFTRSQTNMDNNVIVHLNMTVIFDPWFIQIRPT